MKNFEEVGIRKIEEMLSSEPDKTAWDKLTLEGIFSRAIEDEDNKSWRDLLHAQITFIKEYLATAVRFGLGLPPLNEEGSLVALAVYNATVEWSSEWEDPYRIDIPSTKAVYQEFYRLLAAEDGDDE